MCVGLEEKGKGEKCIRTHRQELQAHTHTHTHTHTYLVVIDELWASICIRVTGDQCPCVGINTVAIESVLQKETPQHH